MAFQIFWKIQFKSLRTNTLYTVNIYKDGTLPSGYPLTLKGGAQPFVTEEDSDEDMFTPIRTQSGYLRIVDDGKATNANGNEVAWNWKELLPATDTSRPVTLTHSSGGHSTVDWVGFMQAQDFGSVLYGNPQEREFPIQCVLTVTQGTDINYQQTAIQNFAYLLKQIVDAIPSAQRPTEFYIQGGSDAQAWLLKKIDWQNFVSEDADGNLTARFNCYDCLQDLCSFWGWTARTKAQTMYLTMADDSAETTWLYMTYANLATMAGGTAAGTTTDTFQTANLDTTNSGDIFASTGNDEYVQRGHNKAVVTADGNTKDYVTEFAPASLERTWGVDQWTDREYYDDTVLYFRDITSFPDSTRVSPLLSGQAPDGQGGSFSMVSIGTMAGGDSEDNFDYVLRFTNSYNGYNMLRLQTSYMHGFYGGQIILRGNIFSSGTQFRDVSNWWGLGNKHMYMKFGIGLTRSSAKWLTINNQGQVSWSSTESAIKLNIAGADDTIGYLYESSQGNVHKGFNSFQTTNLYGYIFMDFLGSDDLPEIDGQRKFYINDFKIEYYPNHGKKYVSNDSCTYVSSNNNSVRNEWSYDAIYASQNAMKFGYGVIMNEDYEPMGKLAFGIYQEYVEQHLANRVTTYWQTSKRRIETELRSNVIPDITPRHKVVLDGTTGYPIAISRDWRDDITKLTILEL